MINREYHRPPDPWDWGEIVCYILTAGLVIGTVVMLWINIPNLVSLIP